MNDHDTNNSPMTLRIDSLASSGSRTPGLVPSASGSAIRQVPAPVIGPTSSTTNLPPHLDDPHIIPGNQVLNTHLMAPPLQTQVVPPEQLGFWEAFRGEDAVVE